MESVKRDRYLQRLVDRMGNGMVKVVTGIRRCGKTYLVFNLFRQYLLESGVDADRIVEVSLDEERNAEYRDPSALDRYLRSRTPEDGNACYVLIDEIQYAISEKELRGNQPPRLYGVLNGLLRIAGVDVYVTGSNSKLLSSDIMTEFRGRGDEVRVRPFSFSEFMQAYDGDVYHGWDDYVVFGGMPLVCGMKTDEQKSRYLENLFKEVYFKDIVARYRLDRADGLDELVNVIASSIGSLTSIKKIAATFASASNSGISEATVKRYLGILEESFLVSEAQRYNVKGRKYIGSPKKFYFEDVGLRNARLGFRQIEESHLMENIVYNELLFRGYSVDVGVVEKRAKEDGKDIRRQLEVDFVANLGSKRLYVQSALAIPDEVKAAQEKASLTEIDDSFAKLVLVKGVMKPRIDERGIVTMGVYDFLLGEDA